MFDDDRASLEANYPFVPICEGITFFKIDIPNFTNRKEEDDPFAEENMQQRWTSNTLPCGLVVTISFSDDTVVLVSDQPANQEAQPPFLLRAKQCLRRS